MNRDSNEKIVFLENFGVLDKLLIGNEGGISLKIFFDVEGIIDFDFCENGDIDLR